MTTWAVLASGPSMNQATADAARTFPCVAVSDTYRLAPWANAIVSCDSAWWRMHPAAAELQGRSICTAMSFEKLPEGVERWPHTTGQNSGLFGCLVAVELGATRLLLLGFDMGGTHFFGPHPAPLKNTKPERFEVFQKQFAGYKPRGVEIINCTPGSKLRAYPMKDFNACLAFAPPLSP